MQAACAAGMPGATALKLCGPCIPFPTSNLSSSLLAVLRKHTSAGRTLPRCLRKDPSACRSLLPTSPQFARLIGTRDHAEFMWRITKDEAQHSTITQARGRCLAVGGASRVRPPTAAALLLACCPGSSVVIAICSNILSQTFCSQTAAAHRSCAFDLLNGCLRGPVRRNTSWSDSQASATCQAARPPGFDLAHCGAALGGAASPRGAAARLA